VTKADPATALPAIATPVPTKLVYGSTLTMVAICFANGLQDGRTASFSQATESLKHSFHVPTSPSARWRSPCRRKHRPSLT